VQQDYGESNRYATCTLQASRIEPIGAIQDISL